MHEGFEKFIFENGKEYLPSTQNEKEDEINKSKIFKNP
jgi:hypothetical protein